MNFDDDTGKPRTTNSSNVHTVNFTPSNDSQTIAIEFKDTAGDFKESSVKGKALEETQIKLDPDKTIGLCIDITFKSISSVFLNIEQNY